MLTCFYFYYALMFIKQEICQKWSSCLPERGEYNQNASAYLHWLAVAYYGWKGNTTPTRSKQIALCEPLITDFGFLTGWQRYWSLMLLRPWNEARANFARCIALTATLPLSAGFAVQSPLAVLRYWLVRTEEKGNW